MGFLDHFKITTNYGAVAVTAAPVIILGGIYMALACIKAKTRKPVLTRSVSLGVLHGGKLPLERLVHYHQARADAASLNDAETKLKSQLEGKMPDLKGAQVLISISPHYVHNFKPKFVKLRIFCFFFFFFARLNIQSKFMEVYQT